MLNVLFLINFTLLQTPTPEVKDGNALIIYIALAAVGALGTIGGMYINTLKKIIETRDNTIKEKDSQLEKAADRLNKNMLLMGDVTNLLAVLNGDHKEYSKEVLKLIGDLESEIKKDHLEIKGALAAIKK